LLAVFLAHVYQVTGLRPSAQLWSVYTVQAALNLYLLADALWKGNRREDSPRALGARLASFLALLSLATPFLLKQFTLSAYLSPETVYGALTLVPMLYWVFALLRAVGPPKKGLGARIGVCVGAPCLIALSSQLLFSTNWGLSGPFALTGWAADVALILLFALFFAFIASLISLVDGCLRKREATRGKRDLPPMEEPLEGGTGSEGRPGGESPADGAPAPAGRARLRSAGYAVFIALLALYLPLQCLFLNNITIGGFLFGDFSSPWFYVLAALNGLAMLVPRKNRWAVLAALFVKSMGLLYVAYFALVFLQYAPVALATFYLGLPLLMLTPIALLAVEIHQLAGDFRFLGETFSIRRVSAVFAGGALLLCGLLLGFCYTQKVNLANALCYLTEDERGYPPVDIRRLQTTLEQMDPYRSRGSWALGEARGPLPILSDLYQAVVLDGNVLSREAYDNLTRVFLPEKARRWTPQISPGARESANAGIADIQTDTEWDAPAGFYRTWIHLTLENRTERANQEYSLTFAVPEGMFIAGYYLDVNGERKQGLVSERSAAQGMYASIVNQSRDPGILYYEYGGLVTLKVFPFAAREIRQTGFLLLHRYGGCLSLGGREVELEGEALAEPMVVGDGCLMPAACKEGLEPLPGRRPRYYAVVDISGRQEKDNGLALERRNDRIRRFAESLPGESREEMAVYWADCGAGLADPESPRTAYGRGGFNLAMAMGEVYRDALRHPDCFPVVVVATDDLRRAAVGDQRRFLRDYPESGSYYLLGQYGRLIPYGLGDNHEGEPVWEPVWENPLGYEGFVFRDDGLDEIAWRNPLDSMEIHYGDDAYQNAFLLQGRAGLAKTWEEVALTLRDSMEQRILTVYSSFIVLETREQEETLLRRNQNILDGKMISPPPVPMSEPGIGAALAAAAVALVCARRKAKHSA